MSSSPDTIPVGDEGLSPEQLLQGQQRILEMVAGGESLANSLQAIAEFSEICLPEMLASILYYDPIEQRLRRGGYGRLPDSFQASVDGLEPGPKAGSCGTCAFRAQRVVSEDVFSDPLWDDFHDFCRSYGIRSAWSSPLISPTDQSLLGVFGMYYPDTRLPSAADLEMVDHMTHLATLAAERYRRDEERRRQALEDALTGLGNRHLLQSRAGELVQQAQQAQSPLCLLFLDLDHFKLFNDNFGHLLGDKLLLQFSQQLRDSLPSAQLLARFGGDEFVAIVPQTIEQVGAQLQQLLQRLAEDTLLIDQVRARLSFSSGLVDLADVDWNIGQAIVQADTAARQAKEGGRQRIQVVDRAQLTAVQHRLQVGQALENALRYGLVHPHAQPIVDLRTGAPLGMELLFRTRAGVLDGVSPQLCVDVAEEAGLIDSLGFAMLRGACQLLREPAIAATELILNVNLSVHQLLRDDFPSEVAQLLAAEGVEARRLCLEITESRWLDPDGPSCRMLQRLVEQGFSLALDDFGTGYASLVLLRSAPFRHIKVDRTFIQGMEDSSEALALCRAMLEMAKAYGIQVTAEGVETENQQHILQDLGYIRAQGYLFARPTAIEDTPALLLRLQRQASRIAQA
ncbi:MAG: GGDEF domain-containing protein [Synechococcaceae cyanobacterium]|nr:GGDEF domain-containing protein [Synechococcaceae cyanobacterium]